MRPRVVLRLFSVLILSPGTTLDASEPPVIPTSYHALTNRTVYPKPTLSVIGAAGSRFVDPTFGARLLRVTDTNTRPGNVGRGYAGPSAAHQNSWNSTSTRFYVRGIDGWFIPYTFDPAAMTATRIQPTSSGDGGLVISSGAEPQFSFLSPDVLFVTGQDDTDRPVVRKYDFSTGTYSDILELRTIASVPAVTYAGALSSSASSPEKLSVVFGGPSQDSHFKVAVFRASAGANPVVVDTQASTISVNGGAPVSTGLPSFYLHHAWIDLSGSYVVLYPVSQSPVSFVVWNLSTHTFVQNDTRPFGHDALGHGSQVNQDCCTSGSYDAAQWQLRTLSAPTATSDLINPKLTPRQIYFADHTSWNNAQADRLVPILSSTYRYYNGTFNTTPWRAWDDEIIAIQTDGGGTGATVWRFAHHRSDLARDDGIDGTYFWYQPHAVISPNGRWALFTSNWEKSLGTAVGGESSGLYRTDVFVVALSAGSFTDDPLTTGSSVVRAVHFTELQARIDVLRVRFRLPVFSWSTPLVGPGVVVRATHLTELRAAVQQAYEAAGQSPPTFADTIGAGSTVISGRHLGALRDAVVALEGS